MVYPKGGWWRAASYVLHRMRRLPDQPHRIARGVAAGVFISFTPLFGFHFLGAAAIAWAIRGNIIAALLGTFFGNPLTTPIIAVSSVALGRWMLGVEGAISPQRIFGDFSRALGDVWHNVGATFSDALTRWEGLIAFFHDIFLPYLIGGLGPGIAFAVASHYLMVPLFHAYQKRRARLALDRAEKRRVAQRDQAERLARALAAQATEIVQPPVEPPPDPR